jgi:tRNA threonylcarbamoyladenosine biosynthesis protein TsaE
MKLLAEVTVVDIKALVKALAPGLKGGEIFGLVGPLGSGKTALVKTLAKQLKIRRRVTSPTFTLLHRYRATLKNKKVFVYHLDLYRAKNFKEIKTLGLEEFLGKTDTITFIEWADKMKKYLPKKTRLIKFRSL